MCLKFNGEASSPLLDRRAQVICTGFPLPLQHCGFLLCETVKSGKTFPTFRKKIMPTLYGLIWRWHNPLKRR